MNTKSIWTYAGLVGLGAAALIGIGLFVSPKDETNIPERRNRKRPQRSYVRSLTPAESLENVGKEIEQYFEKVISQSGFANSEGEWIPSSIEEAETHQEFLNEKQLVVDQIEADPKMEYDNIHTVRMPPEQVKKEKKELTTRIQKMINSLESCKQELSKNKKSFRS